ncbi:MAG: hypothetical protein ACRDJF_05945 [Actinomycetota bacterium]
MPELPQVEITVRRLGAVLVGTVVESALGSGVGTLEVLSELVPGFEPGT